ncbi:recombinase family protein [Glycomyces sp. TRM65418]|uniref:recombinase family protein n=1 Tax=Glycomyces sp. TRM65418 TaxID=2867006 RepID=UPI001CE6E4FC|nr:recombinase family protein [Glycomyces sp. TRM65418]MCC3762663.1 recombinase family protein [Glycomyces sp. TRM65418]QZD56699.1 recombinase family protein [Glycomyces sp. TRM65418]
MSQQQRRRAVAYYRVSTTRQAQTGSQAEEFGSSIASQQAACHRYASQHELDIIEEYAEPGGTATAIDRRPKFRQLLDRVLHQRDVDVVLVYTRSRAFRNAFEAMVIREEFRKIDVELLSVQEPCENGPEGDLVTLILDGVNEYQSRKLGIDVAFKMAATAARGSTPGRAKLGYRNARTYVDGRSTPTIEIDPDRAPYIGTAFRLFASGQYTLRRLRDELSNAGLRTRPTKSHPAGAPVTITQLTKLLRDRTYLGLVQWCGEEYPGNHPALIDQDLFDRVQRVLNDRCRRTRDRKWDHHLKGLLQCARCGDRLHLEVTRNRHGWRYCYFVCAGRQPRTCDLPRLPLPAVEAAVEAHWATVTFSRDEKTAIGQDLHRAAQSQRAATEALRRRLRSERTRLNRLEDQCLEVLGQPDWPTAKLTARLEQVRQQRLDIKRRLDELKQRTGDGQAVIDIAGATIATLDNPRDLFRRLPPKLRKTLGRLCFDHISLDVHNPCKEFLGPAQPGNRGGIPATRINAGDLVVTGERRVELNVCAIADLIIAATRVNPEAPKREHGRDVTVWEIPSYA